MCNISGDLVVQWTLAYLNSLGPGCVQITEKFNLKPIQIL